MVTYYSPGFLLSTVPGIYKNNCFANKMNKKQEKSKQILEQIQVPLKFKRDALRYTQQYLIIFLSDVEKIKILCYYNIEEKNKKL